MKCLINCSGIHSGTWNQENLKNELKKQKAYKIIDCSPIQIRKDDGNYTLFENYIREIVFPEALEACGTPAEVFKSVLIIPQTMTEEKNITVDILKITWKTVAVWTETGLTVLPKTNDDCTANYYISNLFGFYRAASDACSSCGFQKPLTKWNNFRLCEKCLKEILRLDFCSLCKDIRPSAAMKTYGRALVCPSCQVYKKPEILEKLKGDA